MPPYVRLISSFLCADPKPGKKKLLELPAKGRICSSTLTGNSPHSCSSVTEDLVVCASTSVHWLVKWGGPTQRPVTPTSVAPCKNGEGIFSIYIIIKRSIRSKINFHILTESKTAENYHINRVIFGKKIHIRSIFVFLRLNLARILAPSTRTLTHCISDFGHRRDTKHLNRLIIWNLQVKVNHINKYCTGKARSFIEWGLSLS